MSTPRTNRSYSDETKAAVMAALLTGQSVSAVAREYKIPKGTVSSWRRQAAREVEGVEPTSTQKEQIGGLILDFLTASLRALRAQADVFARPEWLRTQSASDLAVLHGVQTDKAIRLLEALDAAAVPDERDA